MRIIFEKFDASRYAVNFLLCLAFKRQSFDWVDNSFLVKNGYILMRLTRVTYNTFQILLQQRLATLFMLSIPLHESRLQANFCVNRFSSFLNHAEK